MLRTIVKIDEEKCNGCGACAAACQEGAIAMIDGKAKLIRDDYCDGLGNCLPACPADAISFEEREAAAYDHEAVLANMAAAEAARKAAGLASDAAGKAAGLASDAAGKAAGLASDAAGKAAGLASDAAGKAAGLASKVPGAPAFSGCPGSASRTIERNRPVSAPVQTPAPGMASVPGSASASQACVSNPCSGHGANRTATMESCLGQWPVQIKLAPVKAPYFQGAKLLIAADCTAYAYGNFHHDFIDGHVTLIGCPKLDSVDYAEKLTEILRQNDIKSVTITRMEVPCCGGIEQAVRQALMNSGKFIPWQVFTIRTDGTILD